jgi:phosphoribosylformimino-5-aminoimidazole carboxamide ribotide isomerase
VRVIPVLDLARGQGVLARGGRRATYAPVRSVLAAGARLGDPLALVRAFRDALGCDECYVADLDAITGGVAQHALLSQLAGLGCRLLVDAGVADAPGARALSAAGAARVVVGLETLPSFAALAAVVRALGPARVVFSLDLVDGAPLSRSGAAGADPPLTPLALASAALGAGAGGLLVLDLARVGSGRGVDPELVASVRRAHPQAELLAGGGVATRGELERLADLGLDGALVATALHTGALTRDDLEAARRRPIAGPGRHPSDSR